MNKQELQNQLNEATRVAENIARLIEVIEAKLAEAEKPKLRHGGTGKDRTGNFVFIDKGALWEKVYERGCGITSTALNKSGDARVLAEWASQLTGNIFDHLKALSEPLKDDFELGEGLRRNIVEVDAFRIIIRPYVRGSVIIGRPDIPGFILKLQRLVATAGREQ